MGVILQGFVGLTTFIFPLQPFVKITLITFDCDAILSAFSVAKIRIKSDTAKKKIEIFFNLLIFSKYVLLISVIFGQL